MDHLKYLLLTTTILFAAACANTSRPGDSIQVNILTQPQEKYRVTNVYIRRHWGHSHVRGNVLPTSVLQRDRGHIDVAAYSKLDVLLFSATTHYQQSLALTQGKFRWRGSRDFDLEFNDIQGNISTVYLAFHRGKRRVDAAGKHINIAKLQ